MSDRVEKIARALYQYDLSKERIHILYDYVSVMYGDPPAAWEELAPAVQNEFRKQAYAVDEALKEK